MARIGIVNTSAVAAGLRSSFPGIQLALVVGICGVVPIHPNTHEEIVLGDVIDSTSVIPGLGDSVDLVVVGGRYDTKEVWAQSEKSISWTTFYLACLSNKEAVLRSEPKPIFRMVASVTRPCLSMADVRYLNRYGASHQVPFAESSTEMVVQIESAPPSRPTELFIEPAVVEVVGAGFDRQANERLLTLRFPRIVKIHQDRTFRDSLDFVAYQRLAHESVGYAAEEDAKSKSASLMKLSAADSGWHRQVARAGLPLKGLEPACSTSTPSADSGTERDDDDETETSNNENQEEDLSIPSYRRRARKRPGSPKHFPDLIAAGKRVKTTREKVRNESESTSVGSRQATNQMPNGEITETCKLQPAHAAQDVSMEMRAMVSSEHESSIHVQFRWSLGNIETPILLDESLRGLWPESGQEFLGLCAQCPLPLTYNKHIILNHDNRQKVISAGNEARLMASHVILVHWPSTHMVLSGVETLGRLCRGYCL
jgi:hypothetical protein